MKERPEKSQVCKRCGRELGEEQESYCPQCQVELEEEGIDPSDDSPDKSEPGAGRRKVALQVVILLVLLGLIIARIPSFMDALERTQPIRNGTWETDAVADECISNLWIISRQLQEGQTPGRDLVCPASGEPYLVIDDGADIKVYCPNPEQHGLRELSVSRTSPLPEVREQ